jgi:hypothetical protein
MLDGDCEQVNRSTVNNALFAGSAPDTRFARDADVTLTQDITAQFDNRGERTTKLAPQIVTPPLHGEFLPVAY